MNILDVSHVSIRYLTGDFKDIGLKEYTMRRLRNDYHVHEFWADKDITFSLEKGDMLGIIGVNGAGKSTLLKVVSGIMEPTKGQIKREGSIAALLELASGFDGELTVRENTYLRGAMLGYTRQFMDEKYHDIIEFAELTEFEDRPFKQLSSGMKSRLAFSIASLVRPDLLILDEVLSVGDGAFQQKSAEKMREIIQGGATTILVSHSIGQVEELCNKVLWLHKGEQIAFGETAEICELYRRFLGGEITIEEVRNTLPQQSISEIPAEKKEFSGADTSTSILEEKAVSSRKTPGEWARSIALFLFSFILMEIYIVDMNPVNRAGDAADIWKAIVGIAEGSPVGSYVMYKGIISCYPHVWFYQLSTLLGLPTFFFFKFYHGVLFAYITTIGVPRVVEYFFQRKPRAWQIICFSMVVFLLWKPTLALDQLIIDLPCCAYFFLAVHMVIRLGRFHKGYAVTTLVAGLFCGLNFTASGQYSIAMLCVLIFAGVQIAFQKTWSIFKKIQFLLVLSIGYIIPCVLNTMFFKMIVVPLVESGSWIPTGDFWLERALLYMLPMVENFPQRLNLRGYSILESIYGSVEAANAAIKTARETGCGWNIQEWFTAFFQYPLDFLILILDRVFMCVTTDAKIGNLRHLLLGYTLLYISLLEMLKQTSTVKDVFQRKTLILIAAFLTILPFVAFSVEPRYAISLQGMIFGTALMGPILEDKWRVITKTVKNLVGGKIKLKDIQDFTFCWELLIGSLFVLICLTHYGDLMAHTYTGLELLFGK